MTLRSPVISLEVMKKMFPSYEQEAEALAGNGLWHYSVEEQKFLSYVPSLKVCVEDATPASFASTGTTFHLRRLSSVYEVKVKDRFPSSLLLAADLRETVEQYLDITPDLSVVVLDNVAAPIIIGNTTALERLVFPSWGDDSYMLKPLNDFLTEEGEG